VQWGDLHFPEPVLRRRQHPQRRKHQRQPPLQALDRVVQTEPLTPGARPRPERCLLRDASGDADLTEGTDARANKAGAPDGVAIDVHLC
jgi:hypothetical protein